MSISRKTLIIILLLMAFFLAANYFIQSQIVLTQFAEIEKSLAKKSVDQVEDAIDDHIDQIDRTVFDWSAWDDTYEYAMDNNEKYVQSNLDADTFTNLRVDLVLFFDLQGKLKWGRKYNHNLEEIQEDVVSANSSLARTFSQAISSIDLSLHSDFQVSKGIQIIEQSPYIFSGRPILTSEGDGPAQGYIVFGRKIDKYLVSKLRDQLKTNFEIKFLPPKTQDDPSFIPKRYTVRRQTEQSFEMSKTYYSKQSPVFECDRRDTINT